MGVVLLHLPLEVVLAASGPGLALWRALAQPCSATLGFLVHVFSALAASAAVLGSGSAGDVGDQMGSSFWPCLPCGVFRFGCFCDSDRGRFGRAAALLFLLDFFLSRGGRLFFLRLRRFSSWWLRFLLHELPELLESIFPWYTYNSKQDWVFQGQGLQREV